MTYLAEYNHLAQPINEAAKTAEDIEDHREAALDQQQEEADGE